MFHGKNPIYLLNPISLMDNTLTANGSFGSGKEGVTMRIGAYNQVAQVYGNQPVKKGYNANGVNVATTMDQVSFSSVGKDMQIAKSALASVPDVREDKVSALKASIANGTYQVSAEDFASKLLAAFDEQSI